MDSHYINPFFTLEEMQTLFSEAFEKEPNNNCHPWLRIKPEFFQPNTLTATTKLQFILYSAISHNKIEIVNTFFKRLDVETLNLFLEAGFDSITPLMYAVGGGSVEIVNLLLSHPKVLQGINNQDARLRNTSLMWAAFLGHSEIVQALINAGANIHLNNRPAITALFAAVQSNCMETLNILIEAHGSNIDEALRKRDFRGKSILDYAAKFSRNPEILNRLMTLLGKDAHSMLRSRAENGRTALMQATEFGSIETLKAIIEHLGDDISVALNEEDALLNADALAFAIMGGRTDAVQVLVNAKANVNKLHNNDVMIPLISATGQLAVLDILLAAGANPLLESNQDTSPLRYLLTILSEPARFAEQQAQRNEKPFTSEELEKFKKSAFRLMGAIPTARLYPQPTDKMTELTSECVRTVNELRNNMFHTLWTLRKHPTLGLPTDVSKMIVSQHCSYPEEHQHRFKTDVMEISLLVDKKIHEKKISKKVDKNTPEKDTSPKDKKTNERDQDETRSENARKKPKH